MVGHIELSHTHNVMRGTPITRRTTASTAHCFRVVRGRFGGRGLLDASNETYHLTKAGLKSVNDSEGPAIAKSYIKTQASLGRYLPENSPAYPWLASGTLTMPCLLGCR